MSESATEADALRVVDAARSRLTFVEGQRLNDRTFGTSIRLAHAKAMLKAAERLLLRARQARQTQLDFGADDGGR
jgi:hypothetical protein